MRVTGPVAGEAPSGAIRCSAPISGAVVCSVMSGPFVWCRFGDALGCRRRGRPYRWSRRRPRPPRHVSRTRRACSPAGRTPEEPEPGRDPRGVDRLRAPGVHPGPGRRLRADRNRGHRNLLVALLCNECTAVYCVQTKALSRSEGTVVTQDMETGRVAQRRRTRRTILDATIELLRSGAEPSVNEIAAAADVSRRTVYLYYPTLDQLVLDAILGTLNTDVDGALRAQLSDDPHARLDTLVTALV